MSAGTARRCACFSIENPHPAPFWHWHYRRISPRLLPFRQPRNDTAAQGGKPPRGKTQVQTPQGKENRAPDGPARIHSRRRFMKLTTFAIAASLALAGFAGAASAQEISRMGGSPNGPFVSITGVPMGGGMTMYFVSGALPTPVTPAGRRPAHQLGQHHPADRVGVCQPEKDHGHRRPHPRRCRQGHRLYGPGAEIPGNEQGLDDRVRHRRPAQQARPRRLLRACDWRRPGRSSKSSSSRPRKTSAGLLRLGSSDVLTC